MQTSRTTSTHVRYAPVIGRYSAWLPWSGIDQAETFWLSAGPCRGNHSIGGAICVWLP